MIRTLSRRPLPLLAAVALTACGGAPATRPPADGGADPGPGPAAAPPPDAVYHVYVGAESADLLHRVRFGPEGASVERTTPLGELATENEGPHGLTRSPDGEYLYVTTGHGFPDGKLWKLRTGADTLVADPILLGRFPATLDLTPDGLYAFVANFNLHGEMEPSTLSVVYTPDMVEVMQIETCVMPHGARLGPRGTHLYSACMMDDRIVEVDTRTFEVSRTLSLNPGPGEPSRGHAPEPAAEGSGARAAGANAPVCAPTWVLPSPDGTRIWVACNRGDRVLEIDRGAWTVTRTFPTGRGPYNLAVTPDGRLLVVTLKQAGAVEFLDLEAGRSLVRSPSSTAVPHGVVVSPDSRYAFVSVEGKGAEPGKVDVFDLRILQRVADVEVGQQAGGIVFWKMERPGASTGS